MEPLLLKFFYLARPMLNGFVNFSIMGLNFFEFATIVFTIVLGLAFAASIVTRNAVPISNIEVWMLVFILWCTAISLVNYDLTVFKSYVKWILPPITYIILKRTLGDRRQYVRCLWLLILGFAIPIGLSALATLRGLGVDEEIFQTGTVRFRGIYNGIHEMGHNTGFCIMLVVAYITLGRMRGKELPIKLTWRRYLFFAVLVVLAGYCLLNTHVRTVYVGLTVFVAAFLFFYSKKMLVVAATAAIFGSIIFYSVLTTIFFDVLDTKYVGENYERTGSGRFAIWGDNLEKWADAPIENKIAGMGIGNWAGNRIPQADDGVRQINNSHNDWLEVVLETGIVGLIITLGLYMAILRAILRVEGREKYAFLSFFCAVVVMNFLSNSYISRVPMAQLFYMLLVYIELKMPRIDGEEIPQHQEVAVGERRILHYQKGPVNQRRT